MRLVILNANSQQLAPCLCPKEASAPASGIGKATSDLPPYPSNRDPATYDPEQRRSASTCSSPHAAGCPRANAAATRPIETPGSCWCDRRRRQRALRTALAGIWASSALQRWWQPHWRFPSKLMPRGEPGPRRARRSTRVVAAAAHGRGCCSARWCGGPLMPRSRCCGRRACTALPAPPLDAPQVQEGAEEEEDPPRGL